MQPLPFFDDTASYGHGVLGFTAAKVSPLAAAALALGFLVYQVNEAEPIPGKLGDFAEFGTGYLLGLLVKK